MSHPIVLSVLVKATLLLVLAGVVSLVLRRRSAATRHLVWALSLSGVLVIPAIELGGPRVSVPAPWPAAAAAIGAIANVGVGGPAGEPEASGNGSGFLPDDKLGESTADPVPIRDAAGPLRASPAAGQGDTRPFPTAAPGARIGEAVAKGIPAVWLAGALIVLLWLSAGRVGLARLARRGLALRGEDARMAEEAARALGLRRPVRILSSPRVSTPLAFGALRPVVVLPAGAGAWPPARRRSALLHELAHVARGDGLTQLIAGIACAVYWFHPGVWLAARALRAQRERACDDRVIEVGTPGAEYAEHLLQVARASRVSAVGSLVAVAMARPSQLEGRLLAALDGRPRGALGTTATAAACVVALLLVLGLGALRPVRAQSPAAPPERPTALEPVSPQSAQRPNPAPPARQETVIQARVAVKPGERILLDLRTGGNVRIRPWEKDSAWVKATLGGRDARQTDIKIGRDDEGVRVRSIYTGSEDVQLTQHHFEVRVPRRFDVEIHSGGGDIDIDGLEGSISGKSGGGELTLTHLRGHLELTTGGGEVRVEDSHLDGMVYTGGGGVKLIDVSGSIAGYSGGGGVVQAGSAQVRGGVGASAGVGPGVGPGAGVGVSKSGSGFAYVTGDSPEARRRAVRELARNAPPDAAVAALERIGREDPDPSVRKAAIEGLRRIDTPEAAKALERIANGH